MSGEVKQVHGFRTGFLENGKKFPSTIPKVFLDFLK